MENLNAWVADLPAPAKTFFYACETAAATGAIVLASNYYAALNGGTPFDWHAQLHTFYVAVGAGCVKAVIDLLKSQFSKG